MRSQEQCLEEELRKAVPWQVTQLKEKVVTLLGVDVARLRAAWPTEKCQRQRIAADIDTLIEVLPRLAATLQEDSVAKPAVSNGKNQRTPPVKAFRVGNSHATLLRAGAGWRFHSTSKGGIGR